jgi:hypothetical protein
MVAFAFRNGEIVANKEHFNVPPDARIVLVWDEAQALAGMVLPAASTPESDRILGDCVHVLNDTASGITPVEDALARMADFKRLLLRDQTSTRRKFFGEGVAEWVWTLAIAVLSYVIYYSLWWNDYAASGGLFENIVENSFAAIAWGLAGFSVPLILRYHYQSEKLPFEEVVSRLRSFSGPVRKAFRNLAILVVAVAAAVIGIEIFEVDVSLVNIAMPAKMIGPGFLLGVAAPQLLKILG